MARILIFPKIAYIYRAKIYYEKYNPERGIDESDLMGLSDFLKLYIVFETAQGYRWSICQVGLVKFENGIITNELTYLVMPPGNYYWNRFIEIYGITPRETMDKKSI